MADPTSQKIAGWVVEHTCEDWQRLDEICIIALKAKCNFAEDYVLELITRELNYVKNILYEDVSNRQTRGETLLYEIDSEELPYIRAVNSECASILRKLRRVDPAKFEVVCSEILNSLGGISSATGMPNDGGIDFIGFDLSLQGEEFTLPSSAKLVVIGQAKRHKDGNDISESELRRFIGGATRKIHQLKKEDKIGALTPVVYAFWTSADFDRNARDFGHDVGLWLMNGVTMSKYLISLNLIHMCD